MKKEEINNICEGGVSAVSPEAALEDHIRRKQFKEEKIKEYKKENVFGNMEYPENIDS